MTKSTTKSTSDPDAGARDAPGAAPPGAQPQPPGPQASDEQAPDKQAHDHGTLARRAGTVMVGTLASRLLGAVRDAVIAASFAVAATDTFFVAWTIPNTLRRLLGEGAVSAAFVPVFAKERQERGWSAARGYLAAFAGCLGLVLVAVSLGGVLTAELWATMYGGGYRSDPLRFAELVHLTRLVFPYILLAGLAALAMGALNSVGRFAVPAFAPALLNVALIAAPFTLVPLAQHFGHSAITGLALAALVGGVMQVGIQLPALRRQGLLPWPRIDFKSPPVRRSLALLAPLLLGTGVHQLNILLSRLLASFLPTGAQSYLYYGQRLVEIPQGMFAVAIASAALPSLAALHSEGRDGEARSTLAFSLRLTLFIALPASAGLIALAEPTVTVLFGRGAFVAGQVVQTANALTVLALGVWAVAATHPLIRMFHAYGDTRTPVLCAALNLVVFAASAALTIGPLAHVGLALSTSVATTAQMLALVVLLRRKLGSLDGRAIAASALRALLASLGMAIVARDVARLGRWEQGGNDPVNLGVFALAASLGVAVYLALAYLLRSPELGTLAGGLARRLRR